MSKTVFGGNFGAISLNCLLRSSIVRNPLQEKSNAINALRNSSVLSNL